MSADADEVSEPSSWFSSPPTESPPPKQCTTFNGIEQMLWGMPKGLTNRCDWYKPVPRLIQQAGGL